MRSMLECFPGGCWPKPTPAELERQHRVYCQIRVWARFPAIRAHCSCRSRRRLTKAERRALDAVLVSLRAHPVVVGARGLFNPPAAVVASYRSGRLSDLPFAWDELSDVPASLFDRPPA